MDDIIGAPRRRRGIAIASIIWNLIGIAALVHDWIQCRNPAAPIPAAQREIWAAMPGWAWAAYAIAVVAGLAGAILLWRSPRSAATLFLISLIAMLLQFGHAFVASNVLGRLGPSAAIMPAIVIAMGVVQLIIARRWSGAIR